MESPFIKVAGFAGSRTLLKMTLTQVFSHGICKTFKKLYFVKHLQRGASGSCKDSIWNLDVDLDVDKRRRFNRIFQKDETAIPPLSLLPPHPSSSKKRLVERGQSIR